MDYYGYDARGLYEPAERKSGSDSLVWISILAVVLAVIAWYGLREGWFAGEASLRGFVVDDYGHAFTTASVALVDSNGKPTYTTEVTGNGRFEFDGVRPGKYLISVITEFGKFPGGLDVFLKKNSTEEFKVIVPQSWFSQQKLAALKTEKRAETEKKRLEDDSCSTGGGGG